MRFSSVLTLTLALFLGPVWADESKPADQVSAAEAAGWEKLNEEDGIQVFRKTTEGSSLYSFRGETVMDTPLQKVLWVICENEHRTEWVDRLYISTVLERVSAHEYVVYQAFGLPFPLSNRDYVYRGKAELDEKTGAVRLHLQSCEHEDAPETVGVRANLVGSSYTLTPIGERHTRVEVEINTDPQGMIPSWLVNLIQKSWPLKTLRGIRDQVDKPYVELYPLPPTDKPVAKKSDVKAPAAKEPKKAATAAAPVKAEGG